VVAKQQAKRALLLQEQERLKREGLAAKQALTSARSIPWASMSSISSE